MKLLICTTFIFFVFLNSSLASERKYFKYNLEKSKFSLTTTLFKPGEAKVFNKVYNKMLQAKQTNLSANIIFQSDEKISEWSAPFEDTIIKNKTAIPVTTASKVDKVGAVIALVRTAYSTVFWVIIGDFNWLQSSAMLGLQAAIHYSFTYKGYNLNILNASKELGHKVLEKINAIKVNDKKWFQNGIKYFTGFMTSNLIGVGFMGIIAWEDFSQTFSAIQVYKDIAFYSVMSLFATGGWNNFLSDQKFKDMPLLSQKAIQRIYQTNGIIMAIAFPLMMNGYTSGTALLGLTGISGIIMMLRGDNILNKTKGFTKKVNCYRLSWYLLQSSKKL